MTSSDVCAFHCTTRALVFPALQRSARHCDHTRERSGCKRQSRLRCALSGFSLIGARHHVGVLQRRHFAFGTTVPLASSQSDLAISSYAARRESRLRFAGALTFARAHRASFPVPSILRSVPLGPYPFSLSPAL